MQPTVNNIYTKMFHCYRDDLINLISLIWLKQKNSLFNETKQTILIITFRRSNIIICLNTGDKNKIKSKVNNRYVLINVVALHAEKKVEL